MNSLKTLLIAALLAALAYGVYVGLTGNSLGEGSDDPAVAWQSAPVVEPGNLVTGSPPLGTPVATTAPPHADHHPTGSAPPYNPEGHGGNAPPFGGGTGHENHSHASSAPPLEANSVGPSGSLRETVQDAPPLDGSTQPSAPDSRYADSRYADSQPSASSSHESGHDHAADMSNFAEALQEVQTQLNTGQLADAHYALSQWYGDARLTAAENEQLMELLNGVAGTVVYSREHLLEPPHRVQAGETLEQIAERYSVPWQLLARINSVRDPNALLSGEELKVIRGPFDALVSLESRHLTLVIDGRYAGRFRIGVGQGRPELAGRFNVIAKEEGPSYHAPDVAISTSTGLRLDLGGGVSIHGAADSSSLDSDDPRGGIRLAPRDIDDVYNILTVGSKVIIQR